jgi:hypothetical protein
MDIGPGYQMQRHGAEQILPQRERPDRARMAGPVGGKHNYEVDLCWIPVAVRGPAPRPQQVQDQEVSVCRQQ